MKKLFTKRVLALVAAFGATATAGVAVGIGQGPDDPGPRDPAELTPRPGSERPELVRADPNGGPPWLGTTSRSQRGDNVCLAIDRRRDGRRGSYHEQDGSFTDREQAEADVCRITAEPVAYNVQTRAAPDGGVATVVIAGVARDDVERLTLGSGADAQMISTSPEGAFLEVIGIPRDVEVDVGDPRTPWLRPYAITAQLDDGTSTRYELSP